MSSPPLPTSNSRTSTSPEPSLPTRSTPTNDDIEAVIKMATSSHPSPDRPLRDTRTQLFVGNLPYRVRWQDLKDLFRRAGTVLRADVSLGPDNRSRGYGTVLLATAEDAGRAIDMFNGYCWQTRVLEVRPDRLGATLDADLNINPSFPNPSVPFVQQALSLPVLSALNSLDELAMALPGNGELLSGGTGMRTLFVGNDLKDLFRAAGAVTRADVALGPDGRSRGFGTVTFVTEDGAERARRMFDGYEFNGRPLKVHYDRFAQSQNIPLVGVSPQAASTSLLPPYDSLPHLSSSLSRLDVLSAHDGRSQSHLDALAQSQLHLDLQRARLEAEGLTSTPLDTLLTRPRSSSFKSRSLTPPALLSQSPSHLQSPVLLQPQGQSLVGSSLGASIVQPALPPSAHSLSQPHSLTESPHPISAKVSSSASSVHNFGAMDPMGSATDLTLVTDLNDVKLTPDSITSSLGTSFGSPRPSLSAGSSQTSSFCSAGSRRPNLSAASSRAEVLNDGASLGFGSQRTSFSSSTRPSFGAAGAEKPSFGASTSEKRLSFGASSEKPLFSAGSAQRLPSGSTTSQNPSLSTSSQRATAQLSAPFLENDGPTPPSSVPLPTMGSSKLPVLAPVAMSLSLPASKSGSHLASVGSASKIASPPPPNSGSVGNDWADLSRIGSPENRGGQASPNHANTQIPPRSTSERVPRETSLLAQSILNTDSSPPHDTTWGASKSQLRKNSPPSKVNGSVDYVTTALGTLGMRRANRVQGKQAEEKRKSLTPSGEQQPQATSSAGSQGHGKKSTQSSSHRHPGPISLPPPTAFTLPPGVVFSPHAHPQSPIYHSGYPVSPMHPHPMGSPLQHPMSSPLHHPAHVHSPLHHPQYGTYHHHATPVPYAVITPHGLPPITPSMPPFTFLPPQAKTPTQNGHAHEEKGSEEWNHATQNEAPKWESITQVSQPPYHPQFSNAPQQRIQYTQIHPHMFSPGIPLSPGIMVPLSPGIVPQAVSMPITGVPVPMTPGVALTPGVTVTPGAFWSHAPWMNPAVGAPVHVTDGFSEQSHTGAEGYFPPVSQPCGDMGYFPPVSDVANDVPREGRGFASESGVSHGENTHEGQERRVSENSHRSPSPGVSPASSPDLSPKSPQDVNRKGGPQVIKRSTSAHCEGGLPKRNGLFHRESDPEVSTATNKGSKET